MNSTFIDTRVKAEQREKYAEQAPSIFDGDVSRWLKGDPPPVPFVIDELIPARMVTLLVSPGGVGKTLLAQTALTAVTAGQPFLGAPVAVGSAVGVFAEDPSEVLWHRQRRINEELGVEMGDLAGSLYCQSFAGVDATLWRGGGTTAFFNKLEKELQDPALSDLQLLVLDNSALLFADSENDRVPVSHFIQTLNGLAKRRGCAILLITHTSKSDDANDSSRAASGSTAWINGARSVLKLQAEGDDAAVLRLIKANHTRSGKRTPLIWRNGVLVRDTSDEGAEGLAKRAKAERIFLEGLDEIAGRGDYVTTAKQGGRFAPKVIARMHIADGLKIADLEGAMEALLTSRRIEIATVKKHANGSPQRGLVRST